MGKVLDAVGSFFGGLFGGNKAKKEYKYNSLLQKEQAALNEQAAVNAYNRNVEQWQRENEYNTPANQIERLREAGINPLSNGSTGIDAEGSTGYASPSSSVGLAQVSSSSIQFDDVLNRLLQVGELVNLKADTKKKEAEAGKNKEETEVINLSKPWTVENSKNTAKKLASEIQLNAKEGKLKDKQLDVMDQSIRNLVAETDKVVAETSYIKKQEDVAERKMQLDEWLRPIETSNDTRRSNAAWSNSAANPWYKNMQEASQRLEARRVRNEEQKTKIMQVEAEAKVSHMKSEEINNYLDSIYKHGSIGVKGVNFLSPERVKDYMVIRAIATNKDLTPEQRSRAMDYLADYSGGSDIDLSTLINDAVTTGKQGEFPDKKEDVSNGTSSW